MQLDIIATGSTGNCYILSAPRGEAVHALRKTEWSRLILDAGVRIDDIKATLGYDLADVAGCLITHEHMDHSKAAGALMHAGIDIYTSAGTAVALGLQGHRLHAVTAAKKFTCGDWVIFPFATEHDAAEPLGFMIRYRPTGETVLYVTDTFYCRYRADGANYIICECNYCADTLDANIASGQIPRELRHRLIHSHFALYNVVDWLTASDLRKCRQIVLVHLSDNNSDERRMVDEITAATGIETEAARAGINVDLRLWPF